MAMAMVMTVAPGHGDGNDHGHGLVIWGSAKMVENLVGWMGGWVDGWMVVCEWVHGWMGGDRHSEVETSRTQTVSRGGPQREAWMDGRMAGSMHGCMEWRRGRGWMDGCIVMATANCGEGKVFIKARF